MPLDCDYCDRVSCCGCPIASELGNEPQPIADPDAEMHCAEMSAQQE